MSRLAAVLALILPSAAFAAPAQETPPAPMQSSATWDDLRHDILGDVAPQDGAALLTLTGPVRANDAATVPIHLRQDDPGRRITAASVVIDENPAPLAARFEFGPAMAPLDLELRVRVDQYSNVRVIAETETGDSFMTGRFVKASGGCSAPASRDPEVALAGLGQMKLRRFPAPQSEDLHAEGVSSIPAGQRAEAQIMLRHPNYSGLQRDQITQLFVPAHFIDRVEVYQGSDLLFTMTGGISISENPVFRFAYTDNGAPEFRVKAHDTEGNLFEQSLPAGGQS